MTNNTDMDRHNEDGTAMTRQFLARNSLSATGTGTATGFGLISAMPPVRKRRWRPRWRDSASELDAVQSLALTALLMTFIARVGSALEVTVELENRHLHSPCNFNPLCLCSAGGEFRRKQMYIIMI